LTENQKDEAKKSSCTKSQRQTLGGFELNSNPQQSRGVGLNQKKTGWGRSAPHKGTSNFTAPATASKSKRKGKKCPFSSGGVTGKGKHAKGGGEKGGKNLRLGKRKEGHSKQNLGGTGLAKIEKKRSEKQVYCFSTR